MDESQGLTVRWSLVDAPNGTLSRLREYVRHSSYERFDGMEGLRFKTWRARAGEWFEGCYVFATGEDRDRFQASFSSDADDSPGSRIVGSGPVLIEQCEVVAVAEGADGFLSAPSYQGR